MLLMTSVPSADPARVSTSSRRRGGQYGDRVLRAQAGEDECIVAAGAVDGVVAPAAAHQVCDIIAGDRVGERAADGVLDHRAERDGEIVERAERGEGTVVQVDGHGLLLAAAVDRVGAAGVPDRLDGPARPGIGIAAGVIRRVHAPPRLQGGDVVEHQMVALDAVVGVGRVRHHGVLVAVFAGRKVRAGRNLPLDVVRTRMLEGHRVADFVQQERSVCRRREVEGVVEDREVVHHPRCDVVVAVVAEAEIPAADSAHAGRKADLAEIDVGIGRRVVQDEPHVGDRLVLVENGADRGLLGAAHGGPAAVRHPEIARLRRFELVGHGERRLARRIPDVELGVHRRGGVRIGALNNVLNAVDAVVSLSECSHGPILHQFAQGS